MSKKIYNGVESKARASKKFYTGIDNLARKVKKMYIGDSDGKARLCYNRIFTWAKYTSKKTGSSVSYGDYETTHSGFNGVLSISPTYLSNGSWDEDYIHTNSDDTEWYITIGSSFTYSKATGTFTLKNSEEFRIAYKVDSSTFGLSNYTIESELVGKYIKDSSGDIYYINDHQDTSYLNIDPKYVAGSPIYTYNYKYDYVGDVTSEDENAYTTGSIANYSSSNSNDIRTSYVKKEV